jgi:hypothetical protein
MTGTVNVFKRSITLPGHSEVSLAAVTMSCWPQLCTDFGGLAGKLCGHYCIYMHTCKCGWCVQCTEHSAEQVHEQSHWLLLPHFCFWAFRIVPIVVDNSNNWICTL